MNAIVNRRNYKSFFNEASRDIILITKYTMTMPGETEQLKAILVYWNQIVSKSFRWKELAEKELDKSSLDKIRRYLRKKLLDDCYQVVSDTNKCKTSSFAAAQLKKKLLEDYEDRLAYIKAVF